MAAGVADKQWSNERKESPSKAKIAQYLELAVLDLEIVRPDPTLEWPATVEKFLPRPTLEAARNALAVDSTWSEVFTVLADIDSVDISDLVHFVHCDGEGITSTLANMNRGSWQLFLATLSTLWITEKEQATICTRFKRKADEEEEAEQCVVPAPRKGQQPRAVVEESPTPVTRSLPPADKVHANYLFDDLEDRDVGISGDREDHTPTRRLTFEPIPGFSDGGQVDVAGSLSSILQEMKLEDGPTKVALEAMDFEKSKLNKSKPVRAFTTCRCERAVDRAVVPLFMMINQTTVGVVRDAVWLTDDVDIDIEKHYGGRLDGGMLHGSDPYSVLAAAEFKRAIRQVGGAGVSRQEGLEMVLCLMSRPDNLKLFPFLVFAQDADEIYIRIAEPTENNLEWVKRPDHCLKDLADEDYLEIHTFGPYFIWNSNHLRTVITVLLAYRSYTFKKPAMKTPSNPKEYHSKRKGCCLPAAATNRAEGFEWS